MSAKLPPVVTPIEAARGEIRKAATQWSNLRQRSALIFVAGTRSEPLFKLYEVLRGQQIPELDVIIESPGGSPDDAFQIATLIRKHSGKASAVVPFWAKSAGTMIALAMDEIVLGELAQLGPIDTNVRTRNDKHWPKQLSSLEIVRAMRETQSSALTLWKLAAKLVLEDEQLTVHGAYELASGFVGHVSGKNFNPVQLEQFGESVRALEITKNYTKSLLMRHRRLNEQAAKRIAERLVEGYASHGYVIDAQELADIGLQARVATGAESGALHELMEGLVEFVDYESTMIELVPWAPTPEPKATGNVDEPVKETTGESRLSGSPATSHLTSPVSENGALS